MGKTAIAIKHIRPEDTGLLGDILEERGYDLQEILAPVEGLKKLKEADPDLLIVLGGPVNVTQANDYPFLKDEEDILRERLGAGKPTIGICLGAQLMAHALDADVYDGDKGKEIGWQALTLSDEATDGPMRHFIDTPVFHWHAQTFDIPKGAQLLGSSDKYPNQVFSYKNSIAFQCHPEAKLENLEEWYVTFVKQITGPNASIHVHELRELTHQYVEQANKQARLFFNEWLDSVGL